MPEKRGTLLTIYGVTDGTSTSGDLTLKSEWFASDVTYLRIDKDIVAKIWAIEISGAPADISIQFTHDVTAGTPTWQTLKTLSLSSAGELSEDRRKPLIAVTGRTGKEAIKLSWSQSTAGVTHVTILLELMELS